MASDIRYYMDAHIPRAVTRGLRQRGVNVHTAQEAGLRTADDLEHLRLAAAQNRVMVSQDVDFLILHKAGVPHAGLVYAPQQTSIGELVRGLMLICDILTPAEMRGRVEFLP